MQRASVPAEARAFCPGPGRPGQEVRRTTWAFRGTTSRQRSCKAAHEKGLTVGVWTVDDAAGSGSSPTGAWMPSPATGPTCWSPLSASEAAHGSSQQTRHIATATHSSRRGHQHAGSLPGRAWRLQRGRNDQVLRRRRGAGFPAPALTRCSARFKRASVTAAPCPLRTPLAGSIHRNYDLLLRHNLSIVGELILQRFPQPHRQPGRCFVRLGAGVLDILRR